MKTNSLKLLLCLCIVCFPALLLAQSDGFYKLKFNSISGDAVDFSSFKGKKVLIVNTASKCGYTPQFKDLEELSNKYKDKLVVIGFPSNDFGQQDPGTNDEIQSFCQENYGVTFLMMEKSSVKGKEKNSVYKWLINNKLNGKAVSEPDWNFYKYLIDEKGNLIATFPSKTSPLSKEITSYLK